jgi:endonuclease/exonuclease/phosphatase family metal-dependent hydrolase
MKFRFLPLLCLIGLAALILSSSLACAKPAGPSIRLVTWNVHATRSGADVIADELRRLAPDVICLQEVESGVLKSPAPNQAQAIALHLGMNFVSTPPPQPGSKEEQIAIFASGELCDPEYLRIDTGRYYGITVEYQPWPGESICVVGVHLTSSDWSSIGSLIATGCRRLREADDLTRRVRAWDGDLIVAGDLNAGPGMLEHASLAFRARWVFTTEPTYPSDWPILQLDHAFLKGSLRAGRIFTRTTTASDHRPLVVDIHLPGRTCPARPLPGP